MKALIIKIILSPKQMPEEFISKHRNRIGATKKFLSLLKNKNLHPENSAEIGKRFFAKEILSNMELGKIKGGRKNH